MSTSIADERRLLAGSEYDAVAKSHYPALRDIAREELVTLARWLREQRAKHRGAVAHRRRVRRGKAEPRAAGEAETASERGHAAKKQVFARALKRVNARIDSLRRAGP